MKGISRIAGSLLLAGATIWAAGGCHGEHPSREAAVYQALTQHELASVEVFQDRLRGVITLKGIVGSPNSKKQAEQLVEQAAPGYTVNNQLKVDTTGLMGMANPHAKAPELEQLAHAPGNATPSSPHGH